MYAPKHNLIGYLNLFFILFYFMYYYFC